MKTSDVVRLSPGQYRKHRFPPVAEPVSEDGSISLDDVHNMKDVRIELQQRLEDGFNQGIQQGHEEGLRQGMEQGKQKGLLEGQKEGFQKGFISGEASGKETFIKAVKPVHQLLEKMTRWQNDREREQREHICELVQKVSQRVIRAELTLMPQQILALVDETLDSLPGKTEKVVVHLNPQDLERITQINADLPQAWKLLADSQLPTGGCQLVTDHAEADAGCDARLEACMQNVREHLLGEAPSSLSDIQVVLPKTEVSGE
ncbi:flagellar assembly protein FliH [Vibrio sp. HA2012]|uniref:flagellar assembly protein FliH n=1 Tax=Vibrio sp. HA2012 TaxID=1971595 RepID=UPI000C2C71D4|nr:flagellar assembly protein FliH [Vibrio sp. HA2012]PJC86444.1 flagellar assembly protein FliH [Vibrio sp. HA2012]